jgi:LPXTG-site transpeptidase (sortase) family protein
MNSHATSFRTFFFLSTGVFAFFSVFLHSIDFVPEVFVEAESEVLTPTPSVLLKKEEARSDGGINTPSIAPYEEYRDKNPLRIEIESAGISTPITVSKSTDASVLERSLLSGAVQYPTDTLLGEKGNMLIFAHSSYLPTVHNKAYRAFNGLGSVKKGESVKVYSQTHEYIYIVYESYKALADEATIAFSADTPLLTLATCNTFGAKEERFIIHAHLKEVRPLSS